jgi:hypothetical protein
MLLSPRWDLSAGASRSEFCRGGPRQQSKGHPTQSLLRLTRKAAINSEPNLFAQASGCSRTAVDIHRADRRAEDQGLAVQLRLLYLQNAP